MPTATEGSALQESHVTTSSKAAKHFGRSPATIRSWAHRYNARRLGTIGRTVYYDLRDLAFIDREIRRGNPIPTTWQARANRS